MLLFDLIMHVSCVVVDLTNKTVGPHEESGFTHAYNVEPITYIPGSAHKNELPVSSIKLYTINS